MGRDTSRWLSRCCVINCVHNFSIDLFGFSDLCGGEEGAADEVFSFEDPTF
jgi:hypothetical protein